MNSPEKLTKKDIVIIRSVYAVIAVWLIGGLSLLGWAGFRLSMMLLGR